MPLTTVAPGRTGNRCRRSGPPGPRRSRCLRPRVEAPIGGSPARPNIPSHAPGRAGWASLRSPAHQPTPGWPPGLVAEPASNWWPPPNTSMQRRWPRRSSGLQGHSSVQTRSSPKRLQYCPRGALVAWGENTAGTATTTGQTNVPPDLTNVVAVAAGDFCGLALRADGTVVAWGDNSYGQTNVPPDLTNVVAVAAGYHHCLALRAEGTVLAWGDDIDGCTDVPIDLTNAVAIVAGAAHTLDRMIRPQSQHKACTGRERYDVGCTRRNVGDYGRVPSPPSHGPSPNSDFSRRPQNSKVIVTGRNRYGVSEHRRGQEPPPISLAPSFNRAVRPQGQNVIPPATKGNDVCQVTRRRCQGSRRRAQATPYNDIAPCCATDSLTKPDNDHEHRPPPRNSQALARQAQLGPPTTLMRQAHDVALLRQRLYIHRGERCFLEREARIVKERAQEH